MLVAEKHNMELLSIIIGVLGLIPISYFVYSRVIRKSHKIDVDVGNVSLARVISSNASHNEKLALVTYGVTLVNSGPDPVTLKDIFLRYRFRRKFEVSLNSIPTGKIQGKESVVMANASDRIIIYYADLGIRGIQRRKIRIV